MKNMLKNNKKGFTLVELLAVIVILALLIVITANTVLPMMNKTEKSGMITYADRVLSTAAASVQADTLVSGNTPTFYYKISALMDQNDYVGCVKVTKDGDDYQYAIKMFSTTDKYYVFASEVASDKTGSSAWAKGTVNNNGTVTDIDLDTDMTYTGTQVTATTAAETGGVEEICNKGADANAKSTNWGNIKAPTS